MYLRRRRKLLLREFSGANLQPNDPPIRLGLLGDSIMQANNTASVAADFMSTFGRGEVAWAQAMWPHFEVDVWPDLTQTTQARYWNGMNQAIGGTESEDQLSRLAQLQSFFPDVVLLAVGFNDINRGDQASAVFPNIQLDAEYFLTRGVPVILGTIRVNPWTSLDARRVQMLDLNDQIRSYAGATDGVTLWDPWTVYSDGSNDPVPGYSYDNIHPGRTGAYFGGLSLLPVLQTLFDGSYDAVPTMVTANSNSLFAGTSGVTNLRSSGIVATGWNLTATGAGTATAVGSKDGSDKQVVTITPQAAGLSTETFYLATTISNVFPVGTWVKSYARFRLQPWDGWRAVFSASMRTQGLMGGPDGATAQVLEVVGDDLVMHLIGPSLQIVPTITTQSRYLQIEIDGTAAGSGTLVAEEYFMTSVPNPIATHAVRA